MAGIERRIGPAYESAWSWALAMTREERQARLKAIGRGASNRSRPVIPGLIRDSKETSNGVLIDPACSTGYGCQPSLI